MPAEVTSNHIEIQLVGSSGPISLGEADDIKITAHPVKSVRQPRKGPPRTNYQGMRPFDVTFKRGKYNGSVEALIDACTDPVRAPNLALLVTTLYPETGIVEQYLYTGVTLEDGASLSTSQAGTDEDFAFTADERKKVK